MRTRWMQLDESWFFMVRWLRSGWQRPEWSYQGEVQLRQIYTSQPAAYYAIVPEGEARAVLDQFSRLERAQEAVEAYFEARRRQLL